MTSFNVHEHILPTLSFQDVEKDASQVRLGASWFWERGLCGFFDTAKENNSSWELNCFNLFFKIRNLKNKNIKEIKTSLNWSLKTLLPEYIVNWVRLFWDCSSRKQGLGCHAYIRLGPWCHVFVLRIVSMERVFNDWNF